MDIIELSKLDTSFDTDFRFPMFPNDPNLKFNVEMVPEQVKQLFYYRWFADRWFLGRYFADIDLFDLFNSIKLHSWPYRLIETTIYNHNQFGLPTVWQFYYPCIFA